MKIYGYAVRDCDVLLELKEASLQVTGAELDRVIDFLTKVRADFRRVGDAAKGGHLHLRDCDHQWSRGDPDLVVVAG